MGQADIRVLIVSLGIIGRFPTGLWGSWTGLMFLTEK